MRTTIHNWLVRSPIGPDLGLASEARDNLEGLSSQPVESCNLQVHSVRTELNQRTPGLCPLQSYLENLWVGKAHTHLVTKAFCGILSDYENGKKYFDFSNAISPYL